jgi:23S rRNA (cytidine2498-2'-O)-methyltransferase
MGQELLSPGSAPAAETGPGWILAPQRPASSDPLAFPHLIVESPVEVRGDSVNALAEQIFSWFAASLNGERIETPYPSWWDGPAERVGLGRRISAVEAAWAQLLKKRLSRLAKLAVRDLPRGSGPARGIFVWFVDFNRAFMSRSAWRGGQRRMADDPAAPSRSYLKIEEAYGILGREPLPGETVVDLGAAPGGWSYSAARRGARVMAIDNGPLKAGALNHPLIEHRRADAFHFAPAPGQPVDWLLADLVEEPHHVLTNLLRPWLENRWCRWFVVNLKFGRVDAIALLQQLRGSHSPLARAGRFEIRHLNHDREEFTVMGAIEPDSSAHPHNPA